MFGIIERRLLFRPLSASRRWVEPGPGLQAQDVFLPLSRRVAIHAWWCVPNGWNPARGAALYCHGNAGNLSQRGEGVKRWLDLLDLAVLIFDYPGYGRSTGRPDEPGCHAAAEACLDWMTREQLVKPCDVILYGGSLGGAVAIEAATRHPYRALVVVSAFTSVPDMAALKYPWLPSRPFIRNRFDNLAKMSRTRGRLFLAHGTADSTIPFAMGEKLFAVSPEPKRFFPMIDHDHRHSPGPDFYDALRTFLAEIDPAQETSHVRTAGDPLS